MKFEARAYIEYSFMTGLPDRIDFGEGVAIRKLTENEKKSVIGARSIDEYETNDTRDCIEFIFDSEPTEIFNGLVYSRSEEIIDKAENMFDRVMLTLRLFKKGMVGYTWFDITQEGKNFWLQQSANSKAQYNYGHSYIVSEKDTAELVNLFGHTKNITKNELLRLAITRFGKSYERLSSEDRLIDLIICFESLFLGTDNELSYRLALGASTFLKDSKSEREEVFNNMKKAYSLRSKIVHGLSQKSEDVQNCLWIAEDYLREIIKKILVSGQDKTQKEFQKSIQDRILN